MIASRSATDPYKAGGPVSLKAMRGYIDKANSLGVTHVALAKKGIAVLVEQCYLAACACGDSLATISYKTVWKSLTKSGRNLLFRIALAVARLIGSISRVVRHRFRWV